MTRERAKELLPIIQAFVEGKAIQGRAVYSRTKEWQDINPDGSPLFDSPDLEWRIKPEPREFWVVINDAGQGFAYDIHENVWNERKIKVREVLE